MLCEVLKVVHAVQEAGLSVGGTAGRLVLRRLLLLVTVDKAVRSIQHSIAHDGFVTLCSFASCVNRRVGYTTAIVVLAVGKIIYLVEFIVVVDVAVFVVVVIVVVFVIVVVEYTMPHEGAFQGGGEGCAKGTVATIREKQLGID